MAFNLVQAGTALYSVSPTGAAAQLTLPAGITLVANRVPRFARFGRYVVVTNTPSRPIAVNDAGTCFPLTPLSPSNVLTLSGQNGGALSGTFLAKQTFIILDANGNTVCESDYGPLMSTAVTIASKYLRADSLSISPDLVSATRLYRTATGPTTSYFKWIDGSGNPLIAGSTPTSIVSDLADAGLSTVAGPTLGPAPDLTLICAYQGRLWGVDRQDVDHLVFTESGTMYAWNKLNSIPIGPLGDDAAGISALIPRRNALGVGRKDSLYQIAGTTLANYAPISLTGEQGGPGVLSQESVVLYKDTAFFLWRDGVYMWGVNGITCISDGKVRSWFTKDDTFNRAMFWRSFAVLNPFTPSYRLYLASAGQSRIDRWIEYDFTTGKWWGPHKTDAFSPTCAVLVHGSNRQKYGMVGSLEGYLSMDQETKNDWGVTPIAFSVTTKKHDGQEPDYEKVWGELSVLGQAQAAGTLDITPTVGDLNAVPQSSFPYDMTQGRQRLYRLGSGIHASLNFANNTINQDVMLYGYEVPYSVIGRR